MGAIFLLEQKMKEEKKEISLRLELSIPIRLAKKKRKKKKACHPIVSAAKVPMKNIQIIAKKFILSWIGL